MLATGPSSLVVLDFDGRHAGLQTLAELEEKFPILRTAPRVKTADGFHIWFTGSVKSKATGRSGFEVKSQGRYVLAPPSVHPCGGAYEWVSQGIPPAPLPTWLLDKWPKCSTAGSGERSGPFVPHFGRQLPTEVQVQVAAFLAANGLTPQRDGRYRGQCVFPHQGAGDCDCPSSFYVSPVTGCWTCFCPDHPGAARRGFASGGPGPLLALAGIPSHRGQSEHRHPYSPGHRKVYAPTVEVPL